MSNVQIDFYSYVDRSVIYSKTVPYSGHEVQDVLTAAIQEGADLTNVDFGGYAFPGFDFGGGKFMSASFRGANLSTTTWNLANVTGAVFHGANIENADFTGAIGYDPSLV